MVNNIRRRRTMTFLNIITTSSTTDIAKAWLGTYLLMIMGSNNHNNCTVEVRVCKASWGLAKVLPPRLLLGSGDRLRRPTSRTQRL